MKRLTGLMLIVSMLLFVGCGGDDDSGTNPPPASTRVVVANLAAAPSLMNVDDAVWNGISATSLSVATGNLKPAVSKPSAIPPNISLKAAVHGDSLFLKMVWTDATHNVWREVYTVGDSPPNFNHDCCDDNAVHREDQVFVLFAGLAGGVWDVWNWRSLTTAPGFLAEGMTLDGTVLESDTVSNEALKPAYRNQPPAGSQPLLMHETGNAFQGNLLYTEDAVSVDFFGYDWQTGQTIPGWIIDTTIFGRIPDIRKSRWAIRAATTWDTTTSQYAVVLSRPMNTGYSDDLNMATLDSVKVKIGILDNQISINLGSGSRGFTGEFWLIF